MAELTTYPTPYYTIYTDLDADGAREAAIRMTKMAEEYRSRTWDFSGAIGKRMPFYLYRNAEDFHARGAPKTSAGYFNGTELVARADDLGPRTWHVVQHEGFHQFARMVIRGQLPVWVNEGLAEYFGEGVFTGDGFVTGVVPQWRKQRIQQTLAAGQFRPLDEMMALSLEEWNSDLAVVNYDQGWSMVQFLAHGDDGNYQRVFAAFVGQLGDNRPWPEAWKNTFGETRGFEQKWRHYWNELPDNPTIDLFVQANVATLTSFLARATSQRQTFATFEEFSRAAAKGELKSQREDWLPPALLADALHDSRQLAEIGYAYTLVSDPQLRTIQLVCAGPDGRRTIGTFALRNGRVRTVKAELATTRRP